MGRTGPSALPLHMLHRFPVPLNELAEDCTIAVKVYDKDLMGSLVDRVRQKGASTAGGTAKLVGDGARAAAKGVGRAGLKGVKAVAGWMGGKGKPSGVGDESGVDSGPEVAAAAAAVEDEEDDVGSEGTAEAEVEAESSAAITGGAEGSEVGSGGGGGTAGGAAKKGSAAFIGSVGGAVPLTGGVGTQVHLVSCPAWGGRGRRPACMGSGRWCGTPSGTRAGQHFGMTVWRCVRR